MTEMTLVTSVLRMWPDQSVGGPKNGPYIFETIWSVSQNTALAQNKGLWFIHATVSTYGSAKMY